MLDLLRGWLFPPACVACDAPGTALCERCAPPPRASIVFAVGTVPAFALGPYDSALRRAIVAMKNGLRDPLDAFAGLLADRAAISGAIVPLPTSRGRAAQRGFDQSAELARRLALRRDATCLEVLEKRGRPQEGRTRQQRLSAAGRFRVRARTERPTAVTLLDDVCTTGATARDAVAALRAAGIGVRRMVFLARTER